MKYDLAASINRRRYATPLKSYLWRVNLPTIPDFSTEEIKDVSSRIVTFSSPFTSIEADKETSGNSFWYYAKSTDIGTITLEVLEYEDGRSYDYFRRWLALINVTKKGSATLFTPPAKYKRNIEFIRMNSYKNDIAMDTYLGYFPTAIGDLTNDYESNTAVRFSVTLTGDDIAHEILKPNESEDVLSADPAIADLIF